MSAWIPGAGHSEARHLGRLGWLTVTLVRAGVYAARVSSLGTAVMLNANDMDDAKLRAERAMRVLFLNALDNLA